MITAELKSSFSARSHNLRLTVTSKAVVGSSAMRIAGLYASAIAIIALAHANEN